MKITTMVSLAVVILLSITIVPAPITPPDEGGGGGNPYNSYYFSDCTTGGSGTVSDPYCIDPDIGGSAVKRSFDFLMDGTGVEVAAGDTIFLGCGVPIGTTECTYHLDGHEATAGDDSFDSGTCGGGATKHSCVGFDPEVSGTSAARIKLTVYCSGGACATVHLSGDSNNDGAYNESVGSVEIAYMFDNVDDNDYPRERCGGSPINCGGHDYYTIDGDGSLNDHVSRIIIEKFARRCFSLRRGGGGWTVNDVICQYGGAGPIGVASAQTEGFYPASLAGDGGIFDQGCDVTVIDGSLDTYTAIVPSRMQGAPNNSFSYVTLRHNCLNGIRQLNNCNGDNEACSGSNSPGATTYDHLTMTDVQGLAQWHQGRYITATNWVARDFYNGIGVEEQMQDVTITDNDIAQVGTYRITSSGKANVGITVNKGDNDSDCDLVDGGGNDCNTQNILVARNKVWGSTFYTGSPTPGFLMGGIYWSGANQAGACTNCVVENNMIWYVQDSDSNPAVAELSLSIVGEDPVTVRNNTMYFGSTPVVLRGASHIFTNNLIVKSNGESGSGNRSELWVGSSAAGSTVSFNNFYDGGDGGTVVCVSDDDDFSSPISMCDASDTTYTCAQVNSTPALGLASGASNKCAAPTLVNTSGAKSTWDLHLDGSDSVCKDSGTSGASDDIDGDSRPQGAATDIGADEELP